MSRLFMFACALFIVVIAAACGSPSTGGSSGGPPAAEYTIEFSTQPIPPVVGQGRLVFTVRAPDGDPISDATLDVRAESNTQGVDPITVQSTGGQAGVYLLNIEWTAPGQWVVTVDLTLADGSVGQRRFDLTVE